MKSLAESQQWDMMRKLCKKDFESLTGRCLESWFRKKYIQTGLWTEVGSWWNKRGENEIDLVAVNSLDKTIEIAEIKRQADKINMTLLEQKAETFLRDNPKLSQFEIKLNAL